MLIYVCHICHQPIKLTIISSLKIEYQLTLTNLEIHKLGHMSVQEWEDNFESILKTPETILNQQINQSYLQTR